MQYMGSKNSIAKYIIPIIEACIIDNDIKNYIEFFVGGANVIDKIHIDGLKKIGYDKNKYLIALLNYGVNCYKQNGRLPQFVETLPRDWYNICRDMYNKNLSKD